MSWWENLMSDIPVRWTEVSFTRNNDTSITASKKSREEPSVTDKTTFRLLFLDEEEEDNLGCKSVSELTSSSFLSNMSCSCVPRTSGDFVRISFFLLLLEAEEEEKDASVEDWIESRESLVRWTNKTLCWLTCSWENDWTLFPSTSMKDSSPFTMLIKWYLISSGLLSASTASRTSRVMSLLPLKGTSMTFCWSLSLGEKDDEDEAGRKRSKQLAINIMTVE